MELTHFVGYDRRSSKTHEYSALCSGYQYIFQVFYSHRKSHVKIVDWMIFIIYRGKIGVLSYI